ncbi:MAG: hypothetical protein V9G19_20120 [Tetrasphaera sp.]
MAYDLIVLTAEGAPEDMAATHRVLLGADGFGPGSVREVTAGDGRTIGLEVFHVRDSSPTGNGIFSRAVPLAVSRFVVRRESGFGQIDVVAVGASQDLEAAVLAHALIPLLLESEEWFE